MTAAVHTLLSSVKTPAPQTLPGVPLGAQS
jgi:hypothetical protein